MISKDEYIQAVEQYLTSKKIIEQFQKENRFNENVVNDSVDNISIDNWKVSPRTHKTLKFNGIETVKDLKTMVRSDIFKWRNAGKKTVDEVTEVAKTYGIDLRVPVDKR